MAKQFTEIDERRTSERFPMCIPVTLLNEGQNVSAVARDISARGIFFYLPLAKSALIDESEDLEFIIEFPPELTMCTSLRVRCTGKVVRKQNMAQDETGVAAQIHEYAFLSVPEEV
jgi:hypothetical protein